MLNILAANIRHAFHSVAHGLIRHRCTTVTFKLVDSGEKVIQQNTTIMCECGKVFYKTGAD